MVAYLHRIDDGCSIVFHSEANRQTDRGYYFRQRFQKTNKEELDFLGCGSFGRSCAALRPVLYLFLVGFLSVPKERGCFKILF